MLRHCVKYVKKNMLTNDAGKLRPYLPGNSDTSKIQSVDIRQDYKKLSCSWQTARRV